MKFGFYVFFFRKYIWGFGDRVGVFVILGFFLYIFDFVFIILFFNNGCFKFFF